MRKAPLTILFALTACAAAPNTPVSMSPEALGANCNDSALGSFVGQSADLELGAKLMRFSRARTLRWVPFGGAVTMDFNPRRLTVQLDQQSRVTSAKCG